MISLLYSVLYSLALVILLPFELLKRPRSLRERWIRERLGVYGEGQGAKDERQKAIWVHAVSVGEVIAAVPLVKKIKERHSSIELVISTVTDTGQKVAAERMGSLARIVYVPFDLPFAVNRAFRRFTPSLCIIMETELWPAMIRAAGRRSMPVLLMNGRISAGSFNGYRKVRLFIRRVLGGISLFCVQNELYAERLRLLGAAPERIRVTGSFKFDTQPPSSPPEWTEQVSGPVLIAGSTHRTEEELILEAYAHLKAARPELTLIVAPRHPERFKEVEELIRTKGLNYVKRSELSGSEEGCSGLVILLDVIGELAALYGAADIAIMGGSFIEHGGQNPLEPAFWGKAIVCGPHMENFPFIEEFYRQGGAVRVEPSALSAVLGDLIASPLERGRMGACARELYEKNAGATERAMALLERYLPGPL